MSHHTSMMLHMIKTSEPPLIIAVSGGVDSVSLLHMLALQKKPMIVAHVNHGIRDDSDRDQELVRELAAKYDLPFVTTKLELASSTSEEKARTKRYQWLEKLAKQEDAASIVTAHHQDDVLETIVINLLRGTGWRGLASLRETSRRIRPLLGMSKAEVVAYAIDHELTWNEDSTNESFRYLRNRVRNRIIPRLTVVQRRDCLSLYTGQCRLRREIDTEGRQVVEKYSKSKAIDRHLLTMVDGNVAIELLKIWLGETLEASRMSDLLLFSKVAKSGDKWSIDANRYVRADKTRLIVLMPSD